MKARMFFPFLAVVLIGVAAIPAFGQNQFVKTLGGTNTDCGRSVVEVSEGGLVVDGYTSSYGAGVYDLLLAKFDGSGNHLWTRTLGGGSSDGGYSVVEVSDGGLVVTGYTNSYGAGGKDLLLAKFDGSGNHLWTRTLGGSDYDYGYSVAEVSDGGLVVTGYTYSYGAGYCDLLLTKFDGSGNHLWIKTLGGTGGDWGNSVVEVSDGGLVVAGQTNSYGEDGWSLLLAKFDGSGNHLWTRTLGGTAYDEGFSVVEASDGGLVVTGGTSSYGAGVYDLLLAKFDGSGNHLWTRTLGGGSSDGGYSVVEVSDGGLVVTGYTYSYGAGVYDLLLAKFDGSGNHLWTRSLGGSDYDYGYSVAEVSDGGLVVTGRTNSYGAGVYDLLLAKFDGSGNTCLGEFVTPGVQSVSPTITTPSPSVNTPSPTITSPDPTVTSPTPTTTVVCELVAGAIEGTVIDESNQQPLEGVLVEAMQGESIIVSDNTESDGSYSIPNLPVGTYNVRASKDGYETKTENGKEVIADQTTTVDFQLNPSPSDTLFFDDFADGNDDGWQKYGGCTWTVENEEYTSSVSGTEVWCLSVAGNSDWADYIFEADVYGEEGVDKVVVVRVVDENNFYAVNVRSDWMGADEVTLSRIVDGVSTEITTAEYSSQLNTWYHIKVKVIGGNIKVRVDDNLVIDYTDTDTPLDHGRIAVTAYSGGYGSATVKFDNVLVGRSSDMLGTISGIVEDSYTEEPLGGVLVEAMQGENIIAHDNSESDGSYGIPDLPPGTYNVRASKDSYETDTQTGKEVTAGQPTTVNFELLLAFSVETEFYDQFYIAYNKITDILELPFQVTNTGVRAIHDVVVGAYAGGEVVPIDVSHWDINPQDGKIDIIEPGGGPNPIHFFGDYTPYLYIPKCWEDKDVTVRVEEIEGQPVNFEDSKELSVYYCIGGELTDLHPFRLDPDGYQFPNPHFSDCFEKKVLELGKLSITIFPELTKDFGGHCFGMSASSIAYFVDPDSKPASVREKDTYAMEPGDDGVIPAIVDYHLTQFLHGRFYKFFWGDDPNEAQSSALDLISANQPCIVALRGGGGHAITGYKIIRDESDTDTLSYLYVYDNERPGQWVYPISFDLVEDTFTWPADTDKDKLYIFEPFVIMTEEQMRAEIQEAVKQTAQNLWSKTSSRFSSVWQRLHPGGKSRSYTGGNLVRMLLTDEFGRRLGFVDGANFVNEIPGSEVVFLESYGDDSLTVDTLSFYDVPKDLNYTVDYFSLDSCYFRAEVLKPESEETALTLGYDSIAVFPNTIATLHVDSLENYDIGVDYDGDGEIDTTIAPTIANSPPAGFDLLHPVNHDSVSTLAPTLTWASSFDLNGDEIHYRVYIDSDSSFLTPDSSEELLDTSWTVTTSLSDSATYYWKVAAFDSLNPRTWCIEPYWDFVIPYGVGVKQGSATQPPQRFALLPNYPNPFNPITEIKYTLPRDCYVKLEIYNILGQKIVTLVEGNLKAGYKTARWDAGSFSSGIYFYRLQAGDFVQTRKMVLIR